MPSYNLGIMYLTGQGAPQDYVGAARWYRFAPNGGLRREPESGTLTPVIACAEPAQGLETASEEGGPEWMHC